MPKVLICRRTEYYWGPDWRGRLAYYTDAELAKRKPKDELRGQRDVFRAWHRFMSTLAHRAVGEQKRVENARQRIRRAVR
jgi:hypothetical protein